MIVHGIVSVVAVVAVNELRTQVFRLLGHGKGAAVGLFPFIPRVERGIVFQLVVACARVTLAGLPHALAGSGVEFAFGLGDVGRATFALEYRRGCRIVQPLHDRVSLPDPSFGFLDADALLAATFSALRLTAAAMVSREYVKWSAFLIWLSFSGVAITFSLLEVLSRLKIATVALEVFWPVSGSTSAFAGRSTRDISSMVISRSRFGIRGLILRLAAVVQPAFDDPLRKIGQRLAVCNVGSLASQRDKVA